MTTRGSLKRHLVHIFFSPAFQQNLCHETQERHKVVFLGPKAHLLGIKRPSASCRSWAFKALLDETFQMTARTAALVRVLHAITPLL